LPRPADGVAKVNTSPFNDDDAAPPFSEEALALAFASHHGDGARYVAAWNKWLFYDGQRWRVDEKKKVLTHSRNLIRAAAALVNKLAEAKRLARYRTNMAVVSLAQADEKSPPASSNGTPIPGFSIRRAASSTFALAQCALMPPKIT
jgi:hypothetical protein